MCHRQQKNRRGRTPKSVQPRRLTLQLAPRQSRVALHIVIRPPFIVPPGTENAMAIDRDPLDWLQSIPMRTQGEIEAAVTTQLDHTDNGLALMLNGEPIPRRDGSFCLPIPAMGIFGQVVIAGRKKPALVVILAHDAKPVADQRSQVYSLRFQPPTKYTTSLTIGRAADENPASPPVHASLLCFRSGSPRNTCPNTRYLGQGVVGARSDDKHCASHSPDP